MYHLENKWEEIGKALRIPLDMIENTRTCGTDLIKLYNILQAFVSFHWRPTLHHLNDGMQSHAVDGAQYQIKKKDRSYKYASSSLPPPTPSNHFHHNIAIRNLALLLYHHYCL